MLAALIIVFREMIEAGLIVGIVLTATRGMPKRGRWVALGIAAGVAGACVLAIFASKLAGLFAGSGQELFNAAVLATAVVMLTWHNVWMAGHGRVLTQEMKQVGSEVTSGQRTLTALAVVVGIAVLREGSEVVLFLYGIAVAGGTSVASMITGGLLGVLGGALVSALMYAGLLRIPARYLFKATSGLITLMAAGLAAQAISFIQQAGYLESGDNVVWDTSAYLSEGSIMGRLLHTLMGYTEAPTLLQVIIYAATIIVIIALMFSVKTRHAPLRQKAAA